jgi:hypothetical protein
VMPDHVHILLTPAPDMAIERRVRCQPAQASGTSPHPSQGKPAQPRARTATVLRYQQSYSCPTESRSPSAARSPARCVPQNPNPWRRLRRTHASWHTPKRRNPGPHPTPRR